MREDGPAARGHMEAQVDLIVAVRGLRLRVLDNSLIDAIKVDYVNRGVDVD